MFLNGHRIAFSTLRCAAVWLERYMAVCMVAGCSTFRFEWHLDFKIFNWGVFHPETFLLLWISYSKKSPSTDSSKHLHLRSRSKKLGA